MIVLHSDTYDFYRPTEPLSGQAQVEQFLKNVQSGSVSKDNMHSFLRQITGCDRYLV